MFHSSQNRWSTVFQEELDEWFDVCSLSDTSQREDLQVQGLRESVAYIVRLVGEEARVVEGGRQRVVLLGLSQGCAAGFLLLL